MRLESTPELYLGPSIKVATITRWSYCIREVATKQGFTVYSGGGSMKSWGGLSADILRVLVQCAKRTQSMRSMLSF